MNDIRPSVRTKLPEGVFAFFSDRVDSSPLMLELNSWMVLAKVKPYGDINNLLIFKYVTFPKTTLILLTAALVVISLP